MIKTFKNIFVTLVLSFYIWLAISYFNVLINNTNPDYIYPSWNLFTLLIGFGS